MGATNSIIASDLQDNIYISYPYLSWKKEEETEENKHINELCTFLKSNIEKPIVQSKIHSIFLEDTLNPQEISKIIDNIINQSYYIIAIVTPETIRSIHQAIEIHHFLEKNKKIVYLMSEADYTPEKIPELKSVIGKEIWLPFYDSETVLESCNKIKELL
jgi:hypothetical protein